MLFLNELVKTKQNDLCLRVAVGCSRKKPCKLCILGIAETLFILPSFFHEQC